MGRMIKVLKEPKRIKLHLASKNILKMKDKEYLEKRYQLIMKKKLNLENPKTFNEKLQWLKLYDRNPEYTKMVDKYEAKKYVGNIIGEKYIIPTLGIWEKFEDIDFDKLPEQFVLKPTHTSGDIFVCKDKSKINYKDLRKKVKKWLKRKYYYIHREWPYKYIKPRIIAEQYMEDENLHEIRDYKFYSFNGKSDYVMLCFDRYKNDTKFIYFDKDWNMIREFSNDGIKYGTNLKIEKPEKLSQMFEIAKKLSANIPFVRVDLYYLNGKIYFGELTFYPSAGFDNERTKEVEEYLTKQLEIKKWEKKWKF